jgi:hypothetical protein
MIWPTIICVDSGTGRSVRFVNAEPRILRGGAEAARAAIDDPDGVDVLIPSTQIRPTTTSARGWRRSTSRR